ncbi:CpsD/CapB family tyrosine-protein kinase [Clostridium sp. DL1XJH146]
MLIVKEDPKSIAAEAFRTLRTNIQYSSIDNDKKTILVTSAGPGEGKSTTLCNLALTLAKAEKKVLILDCDMRKPSVHKKMRLSNKEGLSNYLAGEVELNDIIQIFDRNVYVVTSGSVPPNPSEILSSRKMKAFIEEAKDEYDHILIDTPPVIAVTDAQVLAPIVDGVILVVASKQAEKEAVVQAKELLEKVGANVLGAVLNKADMNSKKGYGYSNYYYYYGEDDHKANRKGIFSKKKK